MALLGARFVLALEPSAVAGAAVGRGLGGPRIRTLARVPLPPGALVATPFDDNVREPKLVAEALSRLAGALGLGSGEACVVLPDGVGRFLLLDVPADVAPERFARFKLLAGLPYPAEQALVDVLPLPGRRVLAAAVRRSVVQGYEAVVRAAGIAQERVDLAPMAAVAALAAEPGGEESGSVDVILGEAAVSLAARRGGQVRAFRNRRRDAAAGEDERLRLEALRTAALGGAPAPARMRLAGPGAPALARRWREQGLGAELAWPAAAAETAAEATAAAEMAWLGAALA